LIAAKLSAAARYRNFHRFAIIAQSQTPEHEAYVAAQPANIVTNFASSFPEKEGG
jgi:hypothetical protein